ncbi:PH domain-containing protein [Micromonospora sp. NPDC005979]|uniref:PH domain-containing protein n=1 Tax=Micromonospora sp. NPDC005979 TaxID=3156726 RepID=UPI0033A025A3
MRRWRRVDPWGFRQVFTGFMVLAGSTMAAVVVVFAGRALAAGTVDGSDALSMVGALPILGVWLTFAFRMHLTGIYVNDEGLRLRHIFRTRTFRWSEVTGFEARPALFLGEPTVRDACWVRTTGGDFESAVQRRSREMGWRKDIGPVLSSDDFEGMLAQLDAERASRRSGPQVVRR